MGGGTPHLCQLRTYLCKHSIANIKMLPFHWTSNFLYACIQILTTSTSLFILATSKARVRYDMSNKQSLSFEKCIHFISHHFKYSLHLFKPSTVLGLGYSVLTRSMLYSID